MREVDIRLGKNNEIKKITLVDESETDIKNYKQMRPVPIKETRWGSAGWTPGYDEKCMGDCLIECMQRKDWLDTLYSCFNECIDTLCRLPPLAQPTRDSRLAR